MGQSICGAKPPIGLYEANLPVEGGKGSSCLFLIDPQNDFIERTGSLTIPTAKGDCIRTNSFIKRNAKKLDQIYVSLDTHMRFHIAHKAFWVKLILEAGEEEYDWSTAEEAEPEDFQIISHQAVDTFERQGSNVVKYVAAKPDFQKWGHQYTKLLEAKGKILTIWPDHCLVGSKGHNVERTVMDAINVWEELTGKSTEYVIKGQNSMTEHYSAMMAEVIIKKDARTKFNTRLYKSLMKHERVFIGGQARSHCVNNTVRHIVARMKKDRLPLSKIYLLEGAMSDVPGCEEDGEKFVEDMRAGGVNFIDIGNTDEMDITKLEKFDSPQSL